MLILRELVSVLGLGGTVAAAVPLFMTVWYLFRARSVASTAASASATGFVIIASVTAAFGLALALGWVAPRLGIVLQDVARLLELGDGPAGELWRWVVGTVFGGG